MLQTRDENMVIELSKKLIALFIGIILDEFANKQTAMIAVQLHIGPKYYRPSSVILIRIIS